MPPWPTASTAIVWLAWAAVVAVFVAGLGVVTRLLEGGTRRYPNPRPGDPLAGAASVVLRLYARLFHRLRVEDPHGVAEIGPGRALVVVANHTAGVDPLLIQAALPFEVRFMMARDMQVSALRPLLRWAGVIPVSRGAPDPGAARVALRHLRGERRGGRGGVIGIFPEGGIERPPRQVLPFEPGVGLLLARSGALALPVVIEGAPACRTAWGAFIRRGRARVRFLEPVDYSGSGLSAAEIAGDLRRRFLEATGWPANDSPSRELILA